MADISKIKLPDGNTYDVKDTSKSSATNWVNGSRDGSVRTVTSAAEDSSYTIGSYAVTEGYNTKANGYSAHAEGYNSVASGDYAHVEGYSTTASNGKDHAEGYQTTASGGCAHAEGYGTTASGLDSHAEGDSTIANHLAQHVFGQYNIADTSTATAADRGKYIEIVGNGSYNTRSNARTLDWSGNEVLAGKLTVGVAGTNSLDVATIGQLPTKTSDLTNDSGFITSDSDEKVKLTSTSATNRYYLTFLDTGNTPITKGLNVHVGNLVYKNDGTTTAIEIGSSLFKGAINLKTATGSAYGVSIEPGSLTSSRVVTLPDKDGTIALTSDIPDVSGFITSETDPVFSASAAAGITATDISNWNAKVSDDKTWNGVSLTKSENTGGTPLYATILAATSATGASLLKITQTPTGGKIAQYDSNAYLHSTTPSANDNSTKVATTAYVNSAVGAISIPIASSSTLGGIKVGETLQITNDGTLNTNVYHIYITVEYDSEEDTYTLTPDMELTDIVGLLENGKDILFYLRGDINQGPFTYHAYNSMDYNYYFDCADNISGNQIRIYSYEENYSINYYPNTYSKLLWDTSYGTIIYSGKIETVNNDNTLNTLILPAQDGTIALTSDIPSKTSDLTNDSGFITGYTETDPVFTASAAHGISTTDITNWNSKQAALVSGTNIKTVNGNSLLGSGNLTITGGSQVQIVRWTENLTTG